MMKKWINNIILIVSILFLFASGYFFVTQRNNPEAFFFGFKPFIISTGSMEPNYPVYTLVVIEQVHDQTIEVGDTIAFKASPIGGKVAFHRVVEIRETGYITKGDNNPEVDQFIVGFDDVVGLELFHISAFASIIWWSIAHKMMIIIGLIILSLVLVGVGLYLVLKRPKSSQAE